MHSLSLLQAQFSAFFGPFIIYLLSSLVVILGATFCAPVGVLDRILYLVIYKGFNSSNLFVLEVL